jgi:hypothetical protein
MLQESLYTLCDNFQPDGLLIDTSFLLGKSPLAERTPFMVLGQYPKAEWGGHQGVQCRYRNHIARRMHTYKDFFEIHRHSTFLHSITLSLSASQGKIFALEKSP